MWKGELKDYAENEKWPRDNWDLFQESWKKELEGTTLKCKVCSILISALAGELLRAQRTWQSLTFGKQVPCWKYVYYFLTWTLGALWPIYLQFPLNQLFGCHQFEIVSEIYWWDLCCAAVLQFQCVQCSLAVLISVIPPKSCEEVMTIFHNFPLWIQEHFMIAVSILILSVKTETVPRIRGRHQREVHWVTLSMMVCTYRNPSWRIAGLVFARSCTHSIPNLCSLSLLEAAWDTPLWDVCGFRLRTWALIGKFKKNRNSEKHNFSKLCVILTALPGHSV